MLELFSIDYDGRLHSHCLNGRCDYRWFLQVTQGAERNLEIQRQIIKGSKPYATLRADLQQGCILPPLVLAAKKVRVPKNIGKLKNVKSNKSTENGIVAKLLPRVESIKPENVYIIDGLQRTNAIAQTAAALAEPERAKFLDFRVRFELWLNIPFGALAYRMLLLNGGQRPMSMKHQVEILSMKLQEELSDIDGIEIITSLEGRRRTKAGQFQLAKLAQAFQAWLQGQPNVDLRNLVMEQLLAESAIETLGASLTGERSTSEKDAFKRFVQWLVEIDLKLPMGNLEFLASETVLQGLAAAVGAAERSLVVQPRMEAGLKRLLKLTKTSPDEDPVGIAEFESLRKGIDPAKVNVGQATRDMAFRAFQEYFIADGTKEMAECWRFAAGRG